MKLYLSLPKNLPRTALTLGTFDGVHLGHQTILKRLREVSPHTTVLTFLNHPLELFNPPAPPLLTHLSLKLSLLASFGIDALIALPFTPELAALSFEALLAHFDLSHLILGSGAVFGQNRQGTAENIQRYATSRAFTLEYLPKLALDGHPVSSSRIRAAIASGDLAKATHLLGRSYALPYPLPPSPLVLPPDGTYPVFFGDKKVFLTLDKGQASLDHEPEGKEILQFL